MEGWLVGTFVGKCVSQSVVGVSVGDLVKRVGESIMGNATGLLLGNVGLPNGGFRG